MPNATIQGVLKKCATQSIKLKQHILEIRHGFKVFMVVVLYTENLANSKMFMAPLIKKSGSSFADTQHMFFDKGIVEVVGNDKLETKTSDELEEIATEHAIECGAEELEIIDANTKHLTVKMWRTWSLDSVIIKKKNSFQFICDPVELQRVKQKLSALGYNVAGDEHVFIPNVRSGYAWDYEMNVLNTFFFMFQNPITLSQVEHDAYEKFSEKLKAFDGVDAIYNNINIEN